MVLCEKQLHTLGNPPLGATSWTTGPVPTGVAIVDISFLPPSRFSLSRAPSRTAQARRTQLALTGVTTDHVQYGGGRRGTLVKKRLRNNPTGSEILNLQSTEILEGSAERTKKPREIRSIGDKMQCLKWRLLPDALPPHLRTLPREILVAAAECRRQREPHPKV